MTDPTPLHETSRVSISPGMANAMVHYGAARQCPGCNFGCPKYPGRYPKHCPRCGGDMGGVKAESVTEEALPVVCTSRSQRIQAAVDAGRASFGPYMNDPSCSRVATVTYAVAETVCESVGGFKRWLEGPTKPHGFYYRVESQQDPVLIFEFDDRNKRFRAFACTAPARYLGRDPRGDIVSEDHGATFEEPLEEGVIQRVADKVIDKLRFRLSGLPKLFKHLTTAKTIWDEAERVSGKRLPRNATLRIAQGLDSEVRAAFSTVREDWTPATPEMMSEDEGEELNEALGVLTVVGLGLAILGGVPLLLGALAKAAKWLGFAQVAKALSHAHHVAHEFETGAIDFMIPAELSYAVYTTMWKHGWRAQSYLGAPRQARRQERNAPVPFEDYFRDTKLQQTVEVGMYRCLLLFFMGKGLLHLLHAPLGALFAAEAGATAVKGVEVGQGLQRATRALQALESVSPENVRMVDLGSAGLVEAIPPGAATVLQVFVTESDAETASTALNLALVPSRRLIGEEQMWVLVHEHTGYALGRGEQDRLTEYFQQSGIHDRVAGQFEDKRSSVHRARKTGEGPTQIRGGTRIHVGHNQDRKPRKNVQQALQNKMNQRRGLRARIQGAKKFHRSRDGKKMHRDLGHYNRGKTQEELRQKIISVQQRMHELHEASYGADDNGTLRTARSIEQPTTEDNLEAILRRLIVTQNLDVLQDVEFDEDTGAIYLFFDPVLMPDEAEEILMAIQQERGDIQLVASPDMSLPGESVGSEWWVLFLPGPEMAQPDPAMFAKRPEDYGTKVQGVVLAQPDQPEALAHGIDVDSMLKSAGS